MGIVNTTSARNLMLISVLGQTSDTTIFDSNSPRLRVLNVWCIQRANGAASDTLSVDDGSDAITDVMDVNKTAKTITRAAKIDTTKSLLAEGDTLEVTWDNGNSDSDVFILCQLLL